MELATQSLGPSGDESAAFQTQFRLWLRDHLPAEWTQRTFPENWPPGDEHAADVAISRAWHKQLAKDRWIAPGWPIEYGGRGLTLIQRMAVAEELSAARAPAPIGFQGVDILGPAIIEFGTPEQRERFLPPILSADELWCQGYSEPESGSDLASIRTRGIRDGDDFIISGQKVWTSYGSRADWCFLLARTGPADSRHHGLTFFLFRMDSPGVDWRPIRQITGDVQFGELFLDDVRVPADQIIGDEGGGWKVAMHSLSHERILGGNVVPMRARLDALIDLARSRSAPLSIKESIVRLESRLLGATGIQARALAMAEANDPRFSSWASLVKLGSTELRQAIAEVACDLLGMSSVAGMDTEGKLWRNELLDSRAATLYAGTSEIQRNIIAEQALCLPREPRQ
jgi:alkylation response protein AidB-like acyl-CoA dehydrogenase